MHAAVIGAGVGGLAAAIALARGGARVTVFERASAPASGGAGLLLQPSGLAALGALGVPACAGLTPITRLEGRRADGRRVLDLDYRRYPAGSGHGVVRAELVDTLAQQAAAAGVSFRFGVAIERLVHDYGTPRLPCCPERNWDLVVAADGAHSALRRSVCARARSRLYDWAALWALIPLPADWPLDVLQQRYRSAGEMAGLLPVRPGDTSPHLGTFFWSIRRDRLTAWREAPLCAWRAQVARLWPALAPLLTGLERHDDLHVATYRDVRVARWQRDRVVLLGDAAHGTSPQLGNGANLALGDAVVLARSLESSADVKTGLIRFERRRRGAVRFYQWASRALTPFFQSDARALPWLRDRALDRSCRAPVLGRVMHSTLCGDRHGWLSSGLVRELTAADSTVAPGAVPGHDPGGARG